MEKTVSSRLIYRGRNFCFKSDEVELPDGRRTRRDIIEHPGAVAIIPILSDGRLILVRQYRYAVHRELLEIPAGTLEEGEEPLECAMRELREETGHEAGRMEWLMRCYMAPGYSSELIDFYVASDLRRVEADAEPDESIEVEVLGFDEVAEMIEENVIEDAKTVTGILAYLTRK